MCWKYLGGDIANFLKEWMIGGPWMLCNVEAALVYEHGVHLCSRMCTTGTYGRNWDQVGNSYVHLMPLATARSPSRAGGSQAGSSHCWGPRSHLIWSARLVRFPLHQHREPAFNWSACLQLISLLSVNFSRNLSESADRSAPGRERATNSSGLSAAAACGYGSKAERLVVVRTWPLPHCHALLLARPATTIPQPIHFPLERMEALSLG